MVCSNVRRDRPLQFDLTLLGVADPKDGGEHLGGIPALTTWYNERLEQAIRKDPSNTGGSIAAGEPRQPPGPAKQLEGDLIYHECSSSYRRAGISERLVYARSCSSSLAFCASRDRATSV